MPGIAVKTLDTAGGKQLNGGQDRFKIDGQPVVVVGDPIQPHGDSPHNAAKMIEGSSWMTWNKIPVVVAGCKASCGHTSSGRSNWNIDI